MSTTRRSFLTALGAVVAGAPLAGWAWLEGAPAPAPRIDLLREESFLKRGDQAWLPIDAELPPRRRCLLTAVVPHEIGAAVVRKLRLHGDDVVVDQLRVEGEEQQLLGAVPSSLLSDLQSPMMLLPPVRGGHLLQLEAWHAGPKPRRIVGYWGLVVAR